MKGFDHHWLIRLYPRAWRARYGDELNEFLVGRTGWKDGFDIARAAVIEHLYRAREGIEAMQTYPGGIRVLARKPSGFVPVVMSLVALSVVLLAIATGHAHRQSDEGASAHIWQLLIAGQLPVLVWFAIHWLRRDLKSGLPVLGLQVVAIAVATFPVWMLGL